MNTIAITGITSFTGAWIARAFAEKGWKVYGLCSQRRDAYPAHSIKAARLKWLPDDVQVIDSLPIETGALASWITAQSLDIWVHHHHWMEDFRSPTYDLKKASEIGIRPLIPLLEALQQAKIQGILHSGTFFEPQEGQQLDQIPTPYALSKKHVWDALSQQTQKRGLLISKIVIPNPVGPLENADRLPPILFQKALCKEKLILKSPTSRSDFLPAAAVAQVYVRAAENLLEHRSSIYRPSGLQCSFYEWVQKMNSELITRHFGLSPVEIELPETEGPFTVHQNSPAEKVEVDWNSFWDDYARFLKSHPTPLTLG